MSNPEVLCQALKLSKLSTLEALAKGERAAPACPGQVSPSLPSDLTGFWRESLGQFWSHLIFAKDLLEPKVVAFTFPTLLKLAFKDALLPYRIT